MKLLFGNTVPQGSGLIDLNLDGFFYNYLRNANDDFEKAVEDLLAVFKDTETTLWTCNPLIPNYLDDDVARELVYIYTEGRLIKFGEDEHLCRKLAFMGPGDALADDGRLCPKSKVPETVKLTVPCGGCGNSDPDKQCLGCHHPF